MLLLIWAALGASAATPKRVLILDSFGRDVSPFSVGVSAFRTTLTRELGQPVDIYEAPLDMARFPGPGFEKPLADFLEHRFAGSPIDLVVPVGEPAIRFVVQYRKRLFAETQMVFMGSDPRRLPPGALEKNTTLVTGKSDHLGGVLDAILQLKPDTTNVVFVAGISPHEKFWTDEFRREWQPYANRLMFSWLNDLSLQQMQDRVRALPPRSVIFAPMLLMDAARVPYDGNDGFEAIHAVANAPVFGCFMNQLGRGAIGGWLYQDDKVGVLAARVAIRILRGEKAADIQPVIIGPSPPTYDWRELTRWGINPNRLPAGSVIEFREPKFLEQYRWHIVGVVVFCCLQTALIVGLLVNRAERRQAEEKLHQSSEVLERSPAQVVITDTQGKITYVNRKFSEVTGYSRDEIIGKNPRILKSGESPAAVYRELWDTITQGRTWRGEFHNRKKSGELYWEWAVISSLTDEDGRITHFVAIKEDITERKQTEVVMHDLSRRLIHAHEVESARLARELHDDVTQRLARLAIDAGRLERGGASVPMAELMRSIREELVRLSEDIHALSYRLHSSVLEELGLAEALKAECDRFSRQESIPATLTLRELPAFIPPETALCLFRVVQESLRNAARHAKASRVEVSLRARDGILQLAVLDDGIGFDPASQRRRPSLGLESMRERVLLVGGEFDLESAPGQGTTILVSVPLQEEKL